jgi:hypothetical protein
MCGIRLLRVVAGFSLLVGCSDPVHDSAVSALGGEAPGIPQGEFHRAGQPCTVCHGPMGPANTQFSIAGTVFAGQNNTVGVDQAQVLMVDSITASPKIPIFTNCVGNFSSTKDIYDPAFPVAVGISSNGAGAQMVGHIGRETSCANCHKDPQGLDSPGHVYVTVTPQPNNPNCPVSPVAGGGGTALP